MIVARYAILRNDPYDKLLNTPTYAAIYTGFVRRVGPSCWAAAALMRALRLRLTE